MTQKTGSICYAVRRGLGYLAKQFRDHGIVTDFMCMVHSGVPTVEEWIEGCERTHIRQMNHEAMRRFCDGKDAMLFFETPFYWPLIEYCKSKKIRTYLITMYECCPIHHEAPHKYLCPSLLDMQYFPTNSELVALPTTVEWKQRGVAAHYIHNGGYLGLRGREGTTLLIEAMRYVRSPLRLTIRVQENVSASYQTMMVQDKRIEYIAETVPHKELYGSGEVAVMPQKFNGCSLPIQEAYASGMLVMTTNRFPMNTWLPTEPMIPVDGYHKAQIGGAYMEFEEAMVDPRQIAQTMDEWFGKEISSFSLRGKAWAEANSWDALLPKWQEVLST